jgi:protein-disulfide isomerase
VYRHFPLNSIHPQAQKAGEASECAADQGKFWEYHDLLFANQESVALGVTQFKKWAAELGLNTNTFNSCLDSGQKANMVQEDLDGGSAAGVTGTPAFFINGVAVVGAQPFSTFQQIIDEQLANS